MGLIMGKYVAQWGTFIQKVECMLGLMFKMPMICGTDSCVTVLVEWCGPGYILIDPCMLIGTPGEVEVPWLWSQDADLYVLCP